MNTNSICKNPGSKEKNLRKHVILFLGISFIAGLVLIIAIFRNYQLHKPLLGEFVIMLHIFAGLVFIYFIARMIYVSWKNQEEKMAVAVNQHKVLEQHSQEIISIYQSLFNSIPDLITIRDRDNSIIESNPAYRNLNGRDSNNYQEKDHDIFTFVEKKAEITNSISEAGSYAFKHTEAWLSVSDKKQFYDLISTPVFNKQQEFIATALIARDITELKTALDIQQRNLVRFGLLTHAYRDIIEISAVDDIFELCGNLIEELLHKPMMIISALDEKDGLIKVYSARGLGDKTEIIFRHSGVEVKSAFYPEAGISDDLKTSFASAKLALLPNGIYDLCCRQHPEQMCKTLEAQLKVNYVYTIGFRKQPGYFGNISLLMSEPIDEEDSRVIEAIMTLASIVAMRNEKIDQIKESEIKYRDLITNSPVIGYTLDSNLKIGFCTNFMLTATGYKIDEVLGQSIKEFLTPKSWNYFESYIYQKIQADGVCNGDELEWIKADGGIMTVLHNGILNIHDTGGDETIEILTDITQRKKTEAALSISENRYRCLVQQAKAGIIEVSPDGKIAFANNELVEIIGYEMSELIGKDVFDFFPDTEQSGLTKYFRKMQQEVVHNIVTKMIHSNGHLIYIMVSSTPVYDEHGKTTSVIVYVSDITEKEIAHRETTQREEFFRALYEQSPMPYHALDFKGAIIDVNEAWLQTFGYEKTEVIGRSLADFMAGISTATFAEMIEKSTKNGTAESIERIMRDKSGCDHNVIINPKVVFDEKGNFVQSHSIVTDITVKKAAEEELKKLHETLETRIKERTISLQEANKELDSFAYSISHDLRTPIRHISGFLEMMQMKKGTLDEKTRENYMQIIYESAHKMGNMVEDLLLFSKMSRTELHKKQINMTMLFKSVFNELIAITSAKNVQLSVSNLPVVTADMSMIKLAVTNLISNAIKYSRNVSDARIAVTAETDMVKNEIRYHIQDNGVGFEMEYYNKLFGVFQRLHPQSEFEGIGIGLANAKRIITRHGGRIWADSKPGEGAMFSFSLPH